MLQTSHLGLFASKVLQEEKSTSRSLLSAWIYLPYFTLYFFAYILNTIAWPVMLVEHSCLVELQDKTLLANSCVETYFHLNSTVLEKKELVGSDVTDIMIITAIISSIIALFCYFVVWKPILRRCPTLSVLIPPICLATQSFLQMYAEKYIQSPYFQYFIVASVCIPSLHGSFQGVLTLYFHMKSTYGQLKFKKTRDFEGTKLEVSNGFPFFAMVFAGFIISTCFEMTYTMIFLLESVFSGLTCIYGILMLPSKWKCDINRHGFHESESDESSDDDSVTSEEARILTNMAKIKQDRGLLSNQNNLFSEAPMIFSESSYRKEFVVIIELTIFTVAIIADTTLSGPYLMQKPFEFSIQEYGYCVSLQGLSKLVGLLLLKVCLHLKGIKHGTVIALAAINYISYYILVGLAHSKVVIYMAMTCNAFGGIALPVIASFIMLNFSDTRKLVIELAAAGSLIATLGFSSLEYFVYIKTKNVVPGAVFFLTAAIIVLGFVLALATYFSTTVRNRRKTKDYADTLLNDYE